VPTKVQSLHPASAPRSPERQRLAEAIARHAAAADRLARIQAAAPRAFDAILAAQRGVDAAETAVAEAREAEPKRLAAKLIGDPEEGGPTLGAVIAAASAASEVLANARAARDALSEQEGAAERDLDDARRGLDHAIAAIVAASPAIAGLLAQNVAARRRVQELGAILTTIGLLRLPQTISARNWDAIRDLDIAEYRAAVAPWQATLASLETDPDTPLPGDDVDASPAAA
jgi:hypothetical protein